MSDGRAEAGRDGARSGVPGAHGEQRDLVVEVNPLLHDDDTGRGARVLLGMCPGGGGLLGTRHAGLAVPGGGHRGLDKGGVANLVEGRGQLDLAAREAEGRRAHAGQGRGKVADALTVHRRLDGEGVGDDAHAALFIGAQLVCRDGLDLGDDEVNIDAVEDLAQGLRVAHVKDSGFVRHLHGGSIVV